MKRHHPHNRLERKQLEEKIKRRKAKLPPKKEESLADDRQEDQFADFS